MSRLMNVRFTSRESCLVGRPDTQAMTARPQVPRSGAGRRGPVDCVCVSAGGILHEGKWEGVMKAALSFALGVLVLYPAISVAQPNPHALRSLRFSGSLL